MLKYCNAMQLKENIERYSIIVKRFPREAVQTLADGSEVTVVPLTPEELDELKGLFNLYDTDGNGSLDIEEMEAIFAFYPDSGITMDDLRTMFKRYGKSEYEGLTLAEFTEFMRESYVDETRVF
jgi:Ca2+-binding EF-hand superfamily protein